MARPIKYCDDSELFAAAEITAELVKEVSAECGLTLGELSVKLNEHGFEISEGMLKQYSSAQKPMGERRKYEFAMIALKLGCRGTKTINVLTFENPDHFSQMNDLLQDVNQGKRFAECMLDRAIHELIDWGCSGEQVIKLVDTAIAKYEPVI